MKTQALFLIAFTLLIVSCGGSKKALKNYKPQMANNQTFKIEQISTDKTYGFTEKNPIKVGFGGASEGPANERRFLNALAGPNGEEISYERLGSCCAFKTDNGFMGGGLLDKYEIKWKGQSEPVILYLNMYDPGELLAPVGFTIR